MYFSKTCENNQINKMITQESMNKSYVKEVCLCFYVAL